MCVVCDPLRHDCGVWHDSCVWHCGHDCGSGQTVAWFYLAVWLTEPTIHEKIWMCCRVLSRVLLAHQATCIYIYMYIYIYISIYLCTHISVNIESGIGSSTRGSLYTSWTQKGTFQRRSASRRIYRRGFRNLIFFVISALGYAQIWG